MCQAVIVGMSYPSSEFETKKTYMLHTASEVIEGRSMFVQPVRKDGNETVFHPVSDWTFYNSVSLSYNGNVEVLRMEKDRVLERELEGYVEMEENDMIVLLSDVDGQIGVRVFHPRIEMYSKCRKPLVRLCVDDGENLEFIVRRRNQRELVVDNSNEGLVFYSDEDLVFSRSSLYNHWLDKSYEKSTHLFWVSLPVDNIDGIKMKNW